MPIQDVKDLPLLEEKDDNVVLFYPHIPKSAPELVCEKLKTRWIGQGPAVDEFEVKFAERFNPGGHAATLGSGTDALHMAYMLADVGPDDEVIVPLFTCTATNIPLLYQGAKPVFADIQKDTMNIDPEHVKKLITDKTKAICCVHYGGLPCDMDELHAIAKDAGIPVIEDAAHALGATYKGKKIGEISDYTMYSFQAIKHITTGDGGMLTFRDPELIQKIHRLRWFGIDRKGKQQGTWQNDIWEVGYKYQMTDIAATMGLAALEEVDEILDIRRRIFKQYEEAFNNTPGLQVIGTGYEDREHACWLFTVIAEKRKDLQRKLREKNIESNQVHFRNDRYTLFKDYVTEYPNMDELEENYLVLPLHTKLSEENVQRIIDTINSGW